MGTFLEETMKNKRHNLGFKVFRKPNLQLNTFNAYKCKSCGKFFDDSKPPACRYCKGKRFKKVKLNSRIRQDFSNKKLANLWSS